jgi:hypothetical protein
VLYAKDGIAIVAGLNADAPLGTKLAFVSGATGCAGGRAARDCAAGSGRRWLMRRRWAALARRC